MNSITNYHNVTNIVLDWADPYDQLDGQLWIKSGIMVFQVCCLLIWTILGIGMVSYERFGEDPQKRGLGNQVIVREKLVPNSRLIGILFSDFDPTS